MGVSEAEMNFPSALNLRPEGEDLGFEETLELGRLTLRESQNDRTCLRHGRTLEEFHLSSFSRLSLENAFHVLGTSGPAESQGQGAPD